MRVGILGGTFDPVHVGHLIVAEEALSRLALDQVLFIPAGQPWLKADQVLSAAEHRLKMVELATASNPRLGVSRIDRLTLWAGGVAPDVDLVARRLKLENVSLTLVVGTRDEYIDERSLTRETDRLVEAAFYFDGAAVGGYDGPAF